MLPMKALHGACNGQAKQYVDDVFSTYLYTGNGSTQTITNGIDLAGEGGLVWIKRRDSAQAHALFDTSRGAGTAGGGNSKILSTNNTAVQGWQNPSGGTVSAFNSNGFTVLADFNETVNASTSNEASWTFRKAAKFFDVQTKSHTNGTASIVDLSSLGTVGMVTVKATSTTSNWYTWHRSLTAGNNLKLNLTDAQSTTNAYLSVSGTTLTIASTAPTATYVVYAFAHDDSAEGLIQCGSFTTDGSGNATVNLGWADGAQYVQIKASSTTGDWEIYDTARTAAWSGSDARLRSNLSSTEDAVSRLSASGSSVSFTGLSASQAHIYMAIASPTN